MIDQEAEHYTAVSEFQTAMPARALAMTYSGNATKKNSQRRWEFAILQILSGMALYAKLHEATYKDLIGNDGLFGPVFDDMLGNVRELLNGEMGRLDGHMMEQYMREFAAKYNLEYPV